MQTVRKSVIVARPAATMFRLVDECEHYPDFLPWCAAAEVHDRTPTSATASLHIDYHGLKASITTHNRIDHPNGIDLEFVEGPFHHFQGHWRFKPLGDTGCRVDFALDYAYSSRALELALGPVFGHIAGTLVERFVERAESIPAETPVVEPPAAPAP